MIDGIKNISIQTTQSTAESATKKSAPKKDGTPRSRNLLATKTEEKKKTENNEVVIDKYLNRTIQLEIDKELKTVVAKIIDKETGAVVRQIPPEEMMKIARFIKKKVGLILDREA